MGDLSPFRKKYTTTQELIDKWLSWFVTLKWPADLLPWFVLIGSIILCFALYAVAIWSGQLKTPTDFLLVTLAGLVLVLLILVGLGFILLARWYRSGK